MRKLLWFNIFLPTAMFGSNQYGLTVADPYIFVQNFYQTHGVTQPINIEFGIKFSKGACISNRYAIQIQKKILPKSSYSGLLSLIPQPELADIFKRYLFDSEHGSLLYGIEEYKGSMRYKVYFDFTQANPAGVDSYEWLAHAPDIWHQRRYIPREPIRNIPGYSYLTQATMDALKKHLNVAKVLEKKSDNGTVLCVGFNQGIKVAELKDSMYDLADHFAIKKSEIDRILHSAADAQASWVFFGEHEIAFYYRFHEWK